MDDLSTTVGRDSFVSRSIQVHRKYNKKVWLRSMLFVYVCGPKHHHLVPHLFPVFQITMSSSSVLQQAASASPMPEGVTDPNYRPLPGRLGNLTVTQQHTLEKFKKELQDEGHFVPERMDDATLLRYVLVCRFWVSLWLWLYFFLSRRSLITPMIDSYERASSIWLKQRQC